MSNTVSTIIVPSASEVLAVARHPHDLADGFRQMQNTLGVSNAWLDDAGGFGDEQIGKFLGPSYAKKIGPFTFQMLCSLLAVEWRMHVDVDRAKQMEGLWEARKPQYVQPRSRPPSRDIVERAKPFVLAANGRIGGLKSASQPTARLRNQKAGKARMRKLTKADRSAMARKGWQTRQRRKAQEVSA